MKEAVALKIRKSLRCDFHVIATLVLKAYNSIRESLLKQNKFLKSEELMD